MNCFYYTKRSYLRKKNMYEVHKISRMYVYIINEKLLNMVNKSILKNVHLYFLYLLNRRTLNTKNIKHTYYIVNVIKFFHRLWTLTWKFKLKKKTRPKSSDIYLNHISQLLRIKFRKTCFKILYLLEYYYYYYFISLLRLF